MENLIRAARSFRKFDNSRSIDSPTIEKLIDLGRLGGSARNCQPWQYMVITEKTLCDKIFPYLGWAGYLTDWKGPQIHQRPVAYILCYLNEKWNKCSMHEAHFDLGIATQNMLLGAIKQDIGGCRIGAFSNKLKGLIQQPAHLSLHLVIALGYPAENVTIEQCTTGEIKYWRDEEMVHHVPKRALDTILLTPPQSLD